MLPLSTADSQTAATAALNAGQTPPPKSEILFGEYLYAMHTAIQANDDRGRALNFFILMTSIVAAALAQLRNAGAPSIAFIALLAGLGFVGWTHFFKIVRLRQAWGESLRCMNRIKEYFLESYPDDVKFRDAFIWKSRTIPSADRAWTISFFAALTITILDSAAIGGAVGFTMKELMAPTDATVSAGPSANFLFVAAAAVALGVALIQTAVYFAMLRGSDKATDTP